MKTLLTIVAVFVIGTECVAERGYDIRITADVCTPFGCQTRSVSCVAVPIRTKETDRQVWLTTAHCFKGYRRGTAQILVAGAAHPAKVIFSREGRHWDRNGCCFRRQLGQDGPRIGWDLRSIGADGMGRQKRLLSCTEFG